MARVIAVYNQKGGVGKTTTCVNLSAYLALLGKKVLLIDFDPQANASASLGLLDEEAKSVYHGMFGLEEPQSLIRSTVLHNYHLIPSSQHLSGALVELVNVDDRDTYLKRFIDIFRDQYDYIFIDLPPSLSLLTINGLVAADEVLIPVQAHYLSLEGLSQLLEVVNLINSNLQKEIKIMGALLTMFDEGERLSHEVAQKIKTHFPYNIFEIRIPRSSDLAEAPSLGRPVVLFNPMSGGAKAYEQLAHEILKDEGGFRIDGPDVSLS